MRVNHSYIPYRESPRETFKVGLTRVCVASGTLNLPYSLQGRFSPGSLHATDLASGASHQLELQPPRTLTGLAEFFESHGLAANDQVVLHLEGERIELEAKRFERRPAKPHRTPAAATRPASDAETTEVTPHGTTIRHRRISDDEEGADATRPAGSPSAASEPARSPEPARPASRGDADAPSDDAPARARSHVTDGWGVDGRDDLRGSWNDAAPQASSWASAFASSSPSSDASEADERNGTVRAVRVSRDGSRVPLSEAPAGADADDGRFDATVGMRIAGGATAELAPDAILVTGDAPAAPAHAPVEPFDAMQTAESDPALDFGARPRDGADARRSRGDEFDDAAADDANPDDADPEGAVRDAEAWPRAIQRAVFDVMQRGRDRDSSGGRSTQAKSSSTERRGGTRPRPARTPRRTSGSQGDGAAPRASRQRDDEAPPTWRPAEQGSLWQGDPHEASTADVGADVPDGVGGGSRSRPGSDFGDDSSLTATASGEAGAADPRGSTVRPAPPTSPDAAPAPAAQTSSRTSAPRPAAGTQVADRGPGWLEAFEREGDLYTRLRWALEHPSMPVIVRHEQISEDTGVPTDVIKEILDGFAVESPSELFTVQRIGKDAYRVSRS